MPKIRSGNKYKVLYDQTNGLVKSGVLTKNYKNIIAEEDNRQGKIPVNNLFSKTGEINYSHTYNDNNTIVFDQKTIDIVTKTDSNVSKNKILSTPSTFTFSNLNINNQNTNSIFYDRLLEKNILEETIEPFDEDTTFHENKTGEFNQDFEIEIPLDFNQSNGGVCQLSINKGFGYTGDRFTSGGFNTFDSKRVQYPKTETSEFFYRFNSPMSYFNFSNNRWDYLGNINSYSYIPYQSSTFHYTKEGFFKYDGDTNYTSLKNWIENTHLGFSGLTNDPLTSTYFSLDSFYNSNPDYDLTNESMFGSPIGSFGFPYELKYEGRKENLISLKKYISKDFVLKEFVVEGTFSSRMIGSPNRSGGNINMNTSQANIAVNFVNFFLINQRKNLNESNITSSQQRDLDIYGAYDEINGAHSDLRYKRQIFNFFKQADFSSNYNRSYFHNNLISESAININLSKESKSQRELITYNTLTHFNDEHVIDKSINIDNQGNPGNAYLVKKERIEALSDKVISDSDEKFSNSSYRGSSLNHPIIHYDKRKIKIKSKVKSHSRDGINYPYSRYRIFTGSINGNRTLLKDNFSGRSNKQEVNTLKKIEKYANFGKALFIRSTDVDPSNSAGYQDEYTPYSVYEIDRKEDYYCLKPEDEILLGINLSTSFSNPEVDYTSASNNSNNGNYYSEYVYGDDTFIIHDLKIKLIGSYHQNENIKSVFNNKALTSKNIRRSSIGNTLITDKIFTTPLQLLSGNYFERSYDNHGIGSSLSSVSNEKSVTNTIKLESEDEILLDSIMPNIIDLLAISNITPNASKQLVVGIPGETSTGNTFSFWYNEGPFLEKYKNVDRPEQIDYSLLLNEFNITSSFGTEIYTNYSSNGGDLFLITDITTDKILKYFYTFNSRNSSRFSVQIRDFDFGTSGTQEKNNLISFEGFKTGAINYKPTKNSASYSSLGFGQYKHINNKFTNYARKVNDLIFYTIEKVFYDSNYIVVDTTQTNTLNTYNKDYYARITKPFSDVSQEEYENDNSLSTP